MLPLLVEFRDAVSSSRRLITAAHIRDALGAYLWPESDRRVVVEAAFLKVYIAWEALQERAFLEYLMGEPSASGNVIHRFAQPIDTDHAAKMLRGYSRFIEWSNHEHVKTLARNFLRNGEPFDAVLSSIASDLSDLKTIRNASAHISTTTDRALNALATRRLQRGVSSISAAGFLLSADPNSPTSLSIFEVSVSTLDAAAYNIVLA